jgi:hypothetical protein
MTYQPNDPNNQNNDPFAPLSSPDTPGYTPPAYTPQQQKKGPNTLLTVLIGAAIATVCICGICAVIAGGSLFTFGKAVMSIVELPDTLPDKMTSKGSIEPNSSESSTLTILDYDVWKYQGRNGEQVTIKVRATTKGLNHIGIYDEQGKVLKKTELTEKNSTETVRTLTYTLSGSGEYSILIGGVSGRYTLDISSDR